MLVQGNEGSQEKPSTGIKGKSTTKAVWLEGSVTVQSSDGDEIGALKRRVANLEAENASLRQRRAPMGTRIAKPSRSSEASVREQRHNFFKYSNIRRY